MLSGKNIVLGVTGGIAVYKACDLVSRLKKLNANVDVIMTKAATEFVNPLTFQTLSQNLVNLDMFEKPVKWDIEHISLAQKADLLLIAPATANIIGKIANGICDDLLTTTVMASEAKTLIVPAMNTKMYENKINQANISKLKEYGYDFMEPVTGFLACKDVGKGKFPDPIDIVENIVEILMQKRDLEGKNILITAGPTKEKIDPVRYITNHSSGKMGYAIATQAVKRGANVTLISGDVNLDEPRNLSKFIKIESAIDMYNAVMENLKYNDIIIKSAAVADYKPKNIADKKIKKNNEPMIIQMDRNPDILKEIGMRKEDKILVGFAAETNDLIENAKAKIEKKNLDFIVANDLTLKGAGFKTDTNIVKIIAKNGDIKDYPRLQKSEIANVILDRILEIKK
ncbi:MAG: bifunctional phosphopantothenoylcysteine decarboxylase/phosphopantothenate--cysteine ligase CoaBC [Peptostreptococcaceae bacterium]|jgi:phosphopantothenoylcysteine decarboxylase/phosphopantothenate--cysteine ligase|nr:bifunctional phosphopantothenoylcysteine decarboxylase/phosphopantothenate--cysteine ligase CoaBC [Peptostreptococcaceae bacterium]